jgi:hypothetical protein
MPPLVPQLTAIPRLLASWFPCARLQRHHTYLSARAGKDVGHAAHCTVAAGGNNDVGLAFQRYSRLTITGVLRCGFHPERYTPTLFRTNEVKDGLEILPPGDFTGLMTTAARLLGTKLLSSMMPSIENECALHDRMLAGGSPLRSGRLLLTACGDSGPYEDVPVASSRDHEGPKKRRQRFRTRMMFTSCFSTHRAIALENRTRTVRASWQKSSRHWGREQYR